MSSDSDPTNEIDTYRRKQKQIKRRIKAIEASRMPKNRAKLTDANIDFRAIRPVTEVISALENLKKELPHTRPRLMKNTYRNILVL